MQGQEQAGLGQKARAVLPRAPQGMALRPATFQRGIHRAPLVALESLLERLLA